MLRKKDTSESHTNIAKSRKIQHRIAEFIENNDTFFPKASEIEWLNLLKKLPEKLKICLLNEISLGNSLIALYYTGWPENGSIVALLSDPFTTSEFDKDLHFRVLNDPHYCNEEISYSENNITHLIIC